MAPAHAAACKKVMRNPVMPKISIIAGFYFFVSQMDRVVV